MTEHRFPVDVLILARRGGKILLTERAGGIYMTGYWAVPAAKSKPGKP